MKTLVAYFSASGKTARKAESLAKSMNADLYEIKPTVPYTKADLDWRDSSSRSSVECHDGSFRPEIVTDAPEINSYDTIYIGFPIWWYTAPNIIKTFLEAYDFSGKEIILFATSGGSHFGRTVSDLMPSAPDADIKEGTVN